LYVVVKHRDFKYGVQVDHNKFQTTDDKLSRVVTSRDPF